MLLAILLALLLLALFGGFGFAVHALWIVAAIILVLFVLGFFVGGGGWYRW